MKFFVPAAENDEQAEQVLASVAKFVGAALPPPGQRLRSISYSHNGRDFTVTVGEPIPAYYEEHGEPVVCIFDGAPLMICLPNRGVIRGDPIYVGHDSVRRSEYFDVPAA